MMFKRVYAGPTTLMQVQKSSSRFKQVQEGSLFKQVQAGLSSLERSLKNYGFKNVQAGSKSSERFRRFKKIKEFQNQKGFRNSKQMKISSPLIKKVSGRLKKKRASKFKHFHAY